MITKFEKVTARIHHLSNVFFAKDAVAESLTSKLSTNTVRRVNENKYYVHFEVTAALLEMIL